MSGPDLRRRQWGTVAGLTLYVVVTSTVLAALVTSGADSVAVAVLALLLLVGFVLWLARTLTRTSSAARRLAADVRVMVDANPSHRLDPVGAGELYLLAAAVNRLGERRLAAERQVQEQVDAARRDMESERDRLAALMAQLRVAVIVCNVDGQILLYNEAARAVVGDTAPMGLGRSVFGVVDRALVAHAFDRLSRGTEPDHAATTLHGDRLLRVRVALVRDQRAAGQDGPGTASGFLLVLEDLTRHVRAAEQRERLLRQLTEGTRASLGSIRAAVESVLDFPDLSVAERGRFLEIVREESESLGRRVDDWVVESAYLDDDRLLTDVTGADLLALLCRELERAEVEGSAPTPPEELWVRADSHAVSRAVVHLATRLREVVGVRRLTLTLTASGRHAQLDGRWRGAVPPAAQFSEWLDETVDGAGSPTVRDVAERHGAEVWCGSAVGDTGYLRLLLPLAGGNRPRPAPVVQLELPSRPEFYDFDLFTPRPQSDDWLERRLDELSYTVFDTETTGLDPAGGDRIVSLGAVRVLNGRLLRQETFEQLVHPQRSVPRASTVIHGIDAEMLEGAPTIAEVLPAFARFAGDTVLVGHNVSFDLQFVDLARRELGGPLLSQPALDTLLLDAALHPDHEDHTLEAIAARLGVSVVGRHTALGDALVTAEVFVGLLSVLRRRGIDTLGEAIATARETYHARVDEALYRR